MSRTVSYECNDRVALITINNPPVNALSQSVRQGLQECIDQLISDDQADIGVICGTGRLFISGADISEFGKAPLPPNLPDVINHIEQCSKPVIAAIHGMALGGGLEVAMGAHYRLADAGARLGLPEVKLGLMPGAGGTQRLPRLVGMETALNMITRGQPVSAAEARQSGLIDRVSSDQDSVAAGIAFARELLADAKSGTAELAEHSTSAALVRRTSDRSVTALDDQALADWRSRLQQSARGEVAALNALDAVAFSANTDITTGLAEERRIFVQLMDTPQRAGMIHAFFAERKVSKLPDIQGVAPKEIRQIGIIGGGTMGAGIATSALLSGYSVVLIERDESTAANARQTIERNLQGALKRGKLDVNTLQTILEERLETATDYQHLAQADLLIEAVFESMEVKRSVFSQLDAVAKPGAILATNTSYLDVDEIAQATSRPEAVIGLHFFSPAHVMKLLEVVVARQSSVELVSTAFALAKKLGKTAVRSGVCDGFIGNRILSHYRTAADHMVLDGASPYQIDKALVDYGFAMGPYAVADLAGLDIGYATRQRKAADRHPMDRYPGWADELYHLGRLGQKSGRGYYLYPEGSRRGEEDPELAGIIDKTRQAAGITPRSFTQQEIVERYMAAMINESARVLEEGIAQRPLDIDVVLLYGYGFPRWRGGPMHTADAMGLDTLLAAINTYAQEDAHFWKPSPLLSELVASGRNFNSLNQP